MADIIKQQEIAKYEKFMHWIWKQKSITSMVLDLGMDGIAKKYVKESVKAKPQLNESVLPISDVNKCAPSCHMPENEKPCYKPYGGTCKALKCEHFY